MQENGRVYSVGGLDCDDVRSIWALIRCLDVYVIACVACMLE